MAEDEAIGDDVVAILGSARVDGRVDGNVVAIAGSVHLGPKANVRGDVTAVRGSVDRADGTVVSGQINEIRVARPRFGQFVDIRPWRDWHWFGDTMRYPFSGSVDLMATLVRVGLVGLIAALLVAVLPAPVRRAADRVAAEPWRAGFVGPARGATAVRASARHHRRGARRLDQNSTDELERFYESCTAANRIALSEDYAQGLHGLLRMIKGRRLSHVKGQVTGPLTFTVGLKDHTGKAIYFYEEFREISLILLQAKARWQIDVLKQHADRVIIFIDEPILSALGSSSYLGVSSEEALRLLSELVSTIKAEGGLAGIHCCGNADWPLVMASGADIVNFDAYDYLDTIALYHNECSQFLQTGGYFAWGLVPTSDAITGENPDSMRERLRAGLHKLSEHIPGDLIRSRILLTPSCGTGSRTVEEAVKIFQLLMRLKELPSACKEPWTYGGFSPYPE